MNEEMKKAIFRKYRDYGFPFLYWEELKQATKIKDEDKVFCYYCGVELEAEGKPPYDRVVTLDRKIPEFLGGKNTIQNTCLCCNKCNVDKGFKTEKQYKAIINDKRLKKKLWELV